MTRYLGQIYTRASLKPVLKMYLIKFIFYCISSWGYDYAAKMSQLMSK